MVLTGRRATVAVLASALLVVAGCQSNGGGTPAPAPPATTGGAAATSTTVLAECAAVQSSGQALATTVGQLIAGNASVDQVRAAATQLSTTIDSAQQTVGPDVKAHLTDAKAALQRVLTAVGAQPPDVAGMRAGVNDVLAALGAAAASCQAPAMATSGPTSGG